MICIYRCLNVPVAHRVAAGKEIDNIRFARPHSNPKINNIGLASRKAGVWFGLQGESTTGQTSTEKVSHGDPHPLRIVSGATMTLSRASQVKILVIFTQNPLPAPWLRLDWSPR
jgi:hypothetical protein